MDMSRIGRASLLVAAIGCVSVANSQAFVNGNFETGDFTGWTLGLTTNGQVNTQTVEQFDIDGGGLLPMSFAGRFNVGKATTAGVAGGGTVTQSMNLNANVLYTFSYMWASRNVSTSVNADGGQYDFIVNGNSIAHIATGTIGAGGLNGETGSFIYGTLTGTFTPTTSGSYVVGAELERAFLNNAGVDQFVDNFTVTAVPEPATIAILGLGFAALAKRRRK